MVKSKNLLRIYMELSLVDSKVPSSDTQIKMPEFVVFARRESSRMLRDRFCCDVFLLIIVCCESYIVIFIGNDSSVCFIISVPSPIFHIQLSWQKYRKLTKMSTCNDSFSRTGPSQTKRSLLFLLRTAKVQLILHMPIKSFVVRL